MPTQKTFKRQVRSRMAKTGESYTAARHQLLRRTDPSPTPVPRTVPPEAMQVSDASMARSTGRTHAEWFGLLDAWGATERRHADIARWLAEEHGVPGWWTQSITVAYERARGMRATHQMSDGFSVGVTRTIGVVPEAALAAFTEPAVRERWLPGVDVRRRPTRAEGTARFDWPDPPSRLVVTVGPKDTGRTVVSVQHERLPDADAAARAKAAWRERLGVLKELLEGS